MAHSMFATAFVLLVLGLRASNDDEDSLSLLQSRAAQLHAVAQAEALERMSRHGASSKGIVRLLDFTKAELVVNNLGGVGPQKTLPSGEKAPEEMRFRNLVQGQKIDLVVKAGDGYAPFNLERNGILGGNAQINAKSGTTVALNFTFVDEGTNVPHPMPLFYITFSDLDERHGGSEKEMIAVDGFTKYYTNDDLSVVGKDSATPAFESVDFGDYSDNNMSVNSPDPIQLTHAVTFSFVEKATFRATFIVTQDGEDVKGRNILFSGISQLVFCKEPSTYLDIKNSVVEVSNLEGQGPNFGMPQEVRFKNVSKFNGQYLDLVLTGDHNVEENWSYRPWNVSQNGLRGEFGVINLWSGHSKTDSEVHLHFEIVESGTNTSVVLDAFAVMYFDFDCGIHEQQVEYIETMATAPGFAGGQGYASYILTKTSEIKVSELANGNMKFEATKHGTEADNPSTSQMMAREEADRAVVFTYRKTSGFHLTFGITPTGYDTGRNLMFAGQDMYLMCD